MFKAWCQKEKLRGSKNLSHVLLTGGCLSVPCDRLDDFNAQYVKAVTAGEKLFVVEQKTQPVYNFFCDIDYKSDEALTVDFIQDVVKVICGKVKNHGGKDCLASIAPPKDAANGKVKTGVHLNWQLPITQVGAVAMREHILVALYTAKPGYDWETIIDKSVYGDPRTGAKGSGFRLRSRSNERNVLNAEVNRVMSAMMAKSRNLRTYHVSFIGLGRLARCSAWRRNRRWKSCVSRRCARTRKILSA